MNYTKIDRLTKDMSPFKITGIIDVDGEQGLLINNSTFIPIGKLAESGFSVICDRDERIPLNELITEQWMMLVGAAIKILVIGNDITNLATKIHDVKVPFYILELVEVLEEAGIDGPNSQDTPDDDYIPDILGMGINEDYDDEQYLQDMQDLDPAHDIKEEHEVMNQSSLDEHFD